MTPPTSGSSRAPRPILGGKSRLGKLLGEGGMGAVYAATPINGDQKYAIKLLHEEMAADPIVCDRFRGEGIVCQRLDHPGVLRVYDVGMDGEVPYLVMELLAGRALIDYTEHQ